MNNTSIQNNRSALRSDIKCPHLKIQRYSDFSCMTFMSKSTKGLYSNMGSENYRKFDSKEQIFITISKSVLL